VSARSSVARIAFACSLALVCACSAQHSTSDTFDIAMTSSLKTLNPLLSTEETEAQAEVLALDPLVTTDDRGNNVPILAAVVPTRENGGISNDGLAITYHLRHNVRWHDGVPFTSRDVQFSWQAIMNPASLISTRHGYDDVRRVDTPDRYTAIFRLKRPFAPAVQTFFALSDAPFMIVPAHILAKYHDLN
jgi:peptide/nickel transport system substrate-binding protein